MSKGIDNSNVRRSQRDVRNVAVLVEQSNSYARSLLAGILKFVRQHAWSVYIPEHDPGRLNQTWISDWNGDGLIARVETDWMAEQIQKCRVPVVDLSGSGRVAGIPAVIADNIAIGELGANYLIERGFKNLGFITDSKFKWSQDRCEAFQRVCREREINCLLYESFHVFDERYSWGEEQARLEEWAASLPSPIGVMACHDIKAKKLIDACHSRGIAVPEEVAVLGVDNEQLLCELSNPPISSIIQDTQTAGYQAATALERMMNGETLPETIITVRPMGVETRLSTDLFAIEDADVASAMRYIRMYATTGINATDVVTYTRQPRKAFEARFRNIVGRTPHQEILKTRMEFAMRLLTESDFPVHEIAERVGYEHVTYFAVAFKRYAGQTPSEYRAATQN